MIRYLVLTLVVLALASCGGEPTATPDLVATQIAVEEAAHATMTARAPTATHTLTPTDTPRPTETSTPTDTPTKTPEPTDEPPPTNTPEPTATWTPTPEPFTRFESEETGFSFDYPARLEITQEKEHTWLITDLEGEQFLIAQVVLGPTDDWYDHSLEEFAAFAVEHYLGTADISFDEVPVAFKRGIDKYGYPGILIRYGQEEGPAFDALVVRSPSHLWNFLFITAEDVSTGWTERTRESIVLTVPPTPTPVAIEPYGEWKNKARKDIEWKMVDKSDAYVGERVCWRGEVFNIDETQGVTFLQAWYFEDRSYNILDDGSDAFVVNYVGTLPKVFEGDPIEACGYIDEQYIGGQNVYGGPLNQPQILGVYVQKYKPKPRATAKPKPPTATPVVAKIGEEFTSGHWLIKITDVQWHKALYFYGDPDVAMGVHAVIFFHMQNQGTGTDYVGKQRWELRGPGGAVYDDDNASTEAAWQFEGLGTPWRDVDPGVWGKFVVAFDVFPEAKGLVLWSDKLEKPLAFIGDAQPAQDQP